MTAVPFGCAEADRREAMIARARATLTDFPAHSGEIETLAAAGRLSALSKDPEDQRLADETMALLYLSSSVEG